MDDETRDDDRIRRAGLDALVRELGPVGMIRFLQMYRQGTGDYTAERHTWLPDGDLDGLVEEIRSRRTSPVPEPDPTSASK